MFSSDDVERMNAYGDMRELILLHRGDAGTELFDVLIGGRRRATVGSIAEGLRLGREAYNAPFMACTMDDGAHIFPRDGAFAIAIARDARILQCRFRSVESAFRYWMEGNREDQA